MQFTLKKSKNEKCNKYNARYDKNYRELIEGATAPIATPLTPLLMKTILFECFKLDAKWNIITTPSPMDNASIATQTTSIILHQLFYFILWFCLSIYTRNLIIYNN